MITDQLFNTLQTTEKIFVDKNISLPHTNNKAEYELKSIDDKYNLLLTVDRRGIMSLKKCKLQNRYLSEPIIRLEIDAPPHTNPDGTTTSRNHIHIYREGFGMSWAYDLNSFDDTLFKNLDEFMCIFYDFCSYCNITSMPISQGVI